jgi:hypothetical protein
LNSLFYVESVETLMTLWPRGGPVVPLDPSAGESQSYVEDCPVCCVPNEITVEYDEDGSARVFEAAGVIRNPNRCTGRPASG